MLLWPLSLVGKLISIAATVGALAVVGGGAFYLMDGQIDASVIDKKCELVGRSTITVETKLFGIQETKPLDNGQCVAIQVGFFVEYFIRSERSIVYEKDGGRCIWDSGHGPCAA